MDRVGFIGGSDVAAIAGLSPYRTALDVWLEKTGQAPPFAGNEATRWGAALEEVIAERYAEETGRVVVKPQGVAVHPAHPWYRAHFDRLVVEPRLLLEIKTANFRQAHRWGEPFTDEIPEEYLAQVHWYLPLLPDCEAAEVPVLIAGNDFRVYRVERDAELEASLLELGAKFWRDHVEARIPPAVDASQSARDWLARRYPADIRPVLEANEDATRWAIALAEAKRALSAAEASKALAENKLKELIGDAAGIAGPGFRVTWKATKGRPVIDWEAVTAEAGINPALIDKHTRRTPVRMFRATFTEEA